MRDYEDPTHIPPVALKLTVAGFIVWLVVVPTLEVARAGLLENIPMYIGLGLTLVGLAIGYLFIHRLIIWFFYAFYWYLWGCAGALMLLAGLTAIVGVVKVPNLVLVSTPAPAIQALFLPGAIFGLGALIYVFRLRGRVKQKDSDKSPDLPKPKPIAGPEDLLKARRRKLGLDD